MTQNVHWSRTSVCLSVSMSVCPRPHAHTTTRTRIWGNGRGCPLVVYYWADLQSVHRFHCYDNSSEREMSASACTCSMAGSYCRPAASGVSDLCLFVMWIFQTTLMFLCTPIKVVLRRLRALMMQMTCAMS